MKELKSIKIIAVDHGYGNIKTANTVTPTGITAYDTEPITASERDTRNLFRTKPWMRTIIF